MRLIGRDPIKILYTTVLLLLVVSSIWARADAPAGANSVAVVATYPESTHPYSNNFDFTWTWPSGAPATYLDVTFDSQTALGPGDQLYILDNYGHDIPGSPFTGTSLAGATRRVPGGNVQIRLLTDAAGTDWGFKVTNITVVDIPAPDLSITKSHEGTFAVGQVGAKYSIFVRNIGTAPTTETVVVNDLLPHGLIANAISGDGWSCVQPGGPCQHADVLPNRGSYPPIVLSVSVAPQPSGTVINTATVSGGGDSNTGNNTAEDPTDIESKGPDLSIFKSHAGNLVQGQIGATYTIIVSNVGQGPTLGQVSVTDTLPPSLTPTGIAGTGWNCTQPAGPCTRADSLPNGSTYPGIGLMVNVAPNAPSLVTNTAKVSAPGDVNSNNDTYNDPTNISIRGPDLRITKTHSGDFTQGQFGATYTLIVSNNGIVASSGQVTVTETAPQGFTVTSMNGGGWNCVQPAGPCTRNEALHPGMSFMPITVTGNVSSTAPNSIINVASVSGGNDSDNTNDTVSDPTTVAILSCDPLPESQHPYTPNLDFTWTCVVPNNPQSLDVTFDAMTSVEDGADFIHITDVNGVHIPGSPFTGTSLAGKTKSVPGNIVKIRLVSNGQNQDYGLKVTNIAPGAPPVASDLTISKTHSGNFVQGHRGAQYTIIVRNVGTGLTAGLVTVNDIVPAGMTAISIAGTGWTCAQPSGPCTRSDGLAQNTNYPPIILTVNVAANAPNSLTNTASVSGGGDTNSNNNTVTDPTTIVPPVAFCTPPGDSTLPETSHPYQNELDQTWTCTLQGNPASLNVSFDPQTLFEGGDMLFIMDVNGNNIAGSPFGGASLAAATKNVPGDTVKLRFVSDNRRSEWGFKVTSITAGAGGGPTAPDLTLTKTHNGDFAQGQNGATYTIIVKNIGTAPSNGTTVTVTDNLPVGLVATNIAGQGWNCAQPSGPCNRSDVLVAGASYPPITLTGNVAGNAPPLVTNNAAVTGGGDTSAGNNNVGDSTNIVPIGCVLPESPHPYPNDFDQTWTCTIAGKAQLFVTFDAQTSIDPGDQLFVTDGNNNNIAGSPFTGVTLAGQTVTVPGNTVKIRLVTDSRRTEWGFKVINVQ